MVLLVLALSLVVLATTPVPSWRQQSKCAVCYKVARLAVVVVHSMMLSGVMLRAVLLTVLYARIVNKLGVDCVLTQQRAQLNQCLHQ